LLERSVDTRVHALRHITIPSTNSDYNLPLQQMFWILTHASHHSKLYACCNWGRSL